MRKYIHLMISMIIGICFFGAFFTLIRLFYYEQTPALQEYIFPLMIGTVLGFSIAFWRIRIREYNVRLEELVNERTADLTIANARLKREIKERLQAERELI